MASLCVGGGAEPRGRTRTRETPTRGRTDTTKAETGSSPAVKRVKVATANVAEPISTVTLFRDIAAGWIKKEEDWYGKPHADYKPIDNQGQERVADSHLEKAREEYDKRFVFSTEEEDAESHQYSGSPYLLVATNVKSTWGTPVAFSHVSFMLVPMQEKGKSALFITFTPGIVHGTIDGAFSDEIGAYLKQCYLKRVVKRCASGGGIYQPDIRLSQIFQTQTLQQVQLTSTPTTTALRVGWLLSSSSGTGMSMPFEKLGTLFSVMNMGACLSGSRSGRGPGHGVLELPWLFGRKTILPEL